MAKQKNISLYLKEWRECRALSLRDAAAEFKTSLPTYRNWEYGVCVPRPSVRKDLAEKLELSTDKVHQACKAKPQNIVRKNDALAARVSSASTRVRSVVESVLSLDEPE